MDLQNTTLTQLRQLLDSKSISAAELTDAYLGRIRAVDGSLLSYITVTPEEAHAQAEQAQARIDAGNATPLTGIPMAMKDNLCTDGVRTTCSSRMLEDFVPPYDATVVEKLKAQNYIMLGKASMDEFAMGSSNQTSAFAKTRNPYDTSCVPGGSSGGSAAAVSAGLCAAALGSDTGGSIRQPASFCGVTGLKPTYGRVSRYGLVAFASSLDQIGPIARCARDCGTVLSAIAGQDPHDATSAPQSVPDFNEKVGKSLKGLKIALPKEFFGDAVDDEVKEAVLAAAREYQSMGAELVDCSISTLKYAVAAYYLIASAEAASNLARFDGIKYGLRGEGNSFDKMIRDSRSRGFGDEVKRRILLGNYALSSGYYDAYYRKALALKQDFIKEYDRIFQTADIILTPTAPTVAYPIGKQEHDPVKMYTGDICTVTVNIACLPAISTTCGYSRTGMPIGMSLIGRRFDEATIIQAADAFEQGFTVIPAKPEGGAAK